MKPVIYLLLALVAGCSVDFNSTDLTLQSLALSTNAVDVTNANAVVTCSATVTVATNGVPVKDVGCALDPPTTGKRRTCVARTSSGGNVWACDIIIPKNSPSGTWSVAYVSVRDMNNVRSRVTKAQLLNDIPATIPNPGAIEVEVTSSGQDTAPPTISAFSATSPVTLGEATTCSVTASDLTTGNSLIKDTSCTFVSPNGQYKATCTAHSGVLDVWSCDAIVDAGAQTGVWPLVRIAARDTIGNTTILNQEDMAGIGGTASITVGSGAGGSIAVDMSALPAECENAEWLILPATLPGSYTGSTSWGPTSVGDDDYQIIWLDLDIDCTPPSPQLQTVAGAPVVFTLSTSNYTVRTPRTLAVTVLQDGVDCVGDPGCSAFGNWTVDAFAPFSNLDFTESGTGSGSLSQIIRHGRQYSISYSGETHYDAPITATRIASESTPNFIGDYIGISGDIIVDVTPDSGPTWTITGPSYPVGQTFAGDQSLLGLDLGAYTIVYDDTILGYTKPGNDAVTLNARGHTFTGTYSSRVARTISVDVGVDDSTPPLTGAPPLGGAWTITATGFGVADSGTGDKPTVANVYDGREYSIAFVGETGYDTPTHGPITASATPQTFLGNYVSTSQAPTYLWSSSEQISSICYGADYCGCEYNTTTCGGNPPSPPCCTDGNLNAELDRVTTAPGQFAIRHIALMSSGADIRAQFQTTSSGQPDIQAEFEGTNGWFQHGNPIWFHQEYYLPNPIVGNGWLGTWGAAVVQDGNPGERLQTNPGLNFWTGSSDNGVFSGNNRVVFAWNSLKGVRSNYSAPSAFPAGTTNYVGLPTAQWFEMELMYLRSGWNVPDGAMQLWINGDLVIDEQNVITYGTNFFNPTAPQSTYTEFEAIWNWYGHANDGTWNPQSPRHYTRNVQVAKCNIAPPYSQPCISDGNAGDPTPPVTDPGTPSSCPTLVAADYTVTNPSPGTPITGFGTTQSESPIVTSTGTAVADFYMRNTVASQDTQIGFSENTPASPWDNYATTIQFYIGDNTIRVLDNDINSWHCDGPCPSFSYGDWQHFRMTVDIDAGTYTVEHAPCSTDPNDLVPIATNFGFRDVAEPVTQLGYWSGWNLTGNNFEIGDGQALGNGVAWSCNPTTCGAELYQCGTPPNGCSSTLSCGSCGIGETCNASYQCVPTQPPASIFPLEIATSTNSTCSTTGNCNRYLVDQNGDPFFIHSEAAWSGMGELSHAEMETYIDDAVAKGFNTLLVTAPETYYTNNTPVYNNFNNVAPFNYSGGIFDLATANLHESWWTYSDYFITYAESKGVAIILAPLYLGCCSDGLYSSICDASNTTGDLTTYGTWVGQHYANQANIIAFTIGNEPPIGTCYVSKMKAFGEAIDAAFNTNGLQANRLGFFHPRQSYTVDQVNADIGIDIGEGSLAQHQWFDLRPLYRWNNVDGPRMMADMAKYEWQDNSPVQAPVFLFEPPYEDDGGGGVTIDVRRSTYHTFLSGALAGNMYGTPHIWDFDSSASYTKPPYWSDSSILNKPGRLQMAHFNALVASVDWWRLVPDFGATIVTSNRGTITTESYVSVAKTTDNQTILVYNSLSPMTKSITVNTTQLASGVGGTHTVQVINPATGIAEATLGPNANSTGTVITPIANLTDYVYVIRNSGGTPATGQIVVNMTTPPPPPSCTGVTWSIPGVASNQSTGGTFTGLAPGNYEITWQDTSFACIPPSPETLFVSSGGSTLFDFNPNNYVVRSTFAPGVATTPGVIGSWTIVAASPFSLANLNQSGIDDEIPVILDNVPSGENFYTGRSYTLNFNTVEGYNPLSAQTITTGETYTGNYTPVGNMDFYATRTTCMAPCAVMFDAQVTEGLAWDTGTYTVRDSKFVWDFDDGGSTVDADGFLAATVFEASNPYDATPDVHTVTLTVDGVPWDTVDITVTDPTTVVCSCDSPPCSGCPGSASYASLNLALAAVGSGSWVLVQGNGASSSQAIDGADNVAVMGWDTATSKPVLTAAGYNPPLVSATFRDLTMSCSDDCFQGNPNGNTTNILIQRIDANSLNKFADFEFDTEGAFLFDNDAIASGYGFYTAAHTSVNLPNVCTRMVAVGNTFNTGDHGTRTNHCGRSLFQRNQWEATGTNSLTIRANADWHLVQDNWFKETTWVGPANCAPPPSNDRDTVVRYVVWERNTIDATGSLFGQGMKFGGQHAIVRNNVTVNTGQWGFSAEQQFSDGTLCTVVPVDLDFMNNTSINLSTGDVSTEGVDCAIGAECEVRGNLFYSAVQCGGYPTGTRSNNWVYCNGSCDLDPGGGGSCNPAIADTTCGTVTNGKCDGTDFAKPATGTAGVDVGYQPAPVWDDHYGTDRPAGFIDVGAVELPAATANIDFYATRYTCTAPCAVQFDAQGNPTTGSATVGNNLTWAQTRDSEFTWDFDAVGGDTDVDSRGFLAATVYEASDPTDGLPDTHTVTLYVDGVKWKTREITVNDPTAINCVGTVTHAICDTHTTDMTTALNNTQSGEWLLFREGESWVNVNLSSIGGDKNGETYGAYGNLGYGDVDAGKPVVAPTAGTGWTPGTDQRFVDLRINFAVQFTALEPRGASSLLYRTTIVATEVSGATADACYYTAYPNNFVIENDWNCPDYGGSLGDFGGMPHRFVMKDTNIVRQVPGQHGFRINPGTTSSSQKVLFQRFQSTPFFAQNALRISGAEWSLFQDMYLERASGPNIQGAGNNYLIIEGSTVITDYINIWEMRDATNIAFRNNFGIGLAGAGHGMWMENTDSTVWVYNNTFYQPNGTDEFRTVVCPNCTVYGNLVYAQNPLGLGCIDNGTGADSNNWCFSPVRTAWCVDPVTNATGSCSTNPNFLDVSCSGYTDGKCNDPDFLRPALGSRGVNNGYQTLQLWEDYNHDPRDDGLFDVGAVER